MSNPVNIPAPAGNIRDVEEYREGYFLKFGRSTICSNHEIRLCHRDCIKAKVDVEWDRRGYSTTNPDVLWNAVLDLMKQRVGQPGVRNDDVTELSWGVR